MHQRKALCCDPPPLQFCSVPQIMVSGVLLYKFVITLHGDCPLSQASGGHNLGRFDWPALPCGDDVVVPGAQAPQGTRGGARLVAGSSWERSVRIAL